MSQLTAIVLVVLVELLIAVLAMAAYLGWRLRRQSRTPAAGEDNGGVARHFAHEIDATRAWPEEHQAAAAARRRALEAEAEALALADGEQRRGVLAPAYAPPAGGGDTESAAQREELERLRRLLHREDRQVRELLDVRERFQDLKLRYDRVRRLLEQIQASVADGGEVDRRALDTFLKAEQAWHQAMSGFGDNLESATEHLEPAGAEPPAEEADAREITGRLNEIIQALRERTADDTEAGARLDELAAQVREFESCVRILEDGNRYLQAQLRTAAGASAPISDAEAAQVIAMKDREIRELRERLEESPGTDDEPRAG